MGPGRTSDRTSRTTVIAACPLCEATCGLEIEVSRDGPQSRVAAIRGNKQDVFSRGFICPKGASLARLHEDPDRLTSPLVKTSRGHVSVGWDEAWRRVQTALRAAIDEHGKESIATYLGNPTAHSLDTQTFVRVLLRAIGSRQRYSAATVDQAPKQVASGYLFGSAAAVAIPDIDRTDFLLILGANPLVSNGSLCVAPDWPGRMKAIQARGGKIVTVDPRRTRTAGKSDEWIGIRPATDAAWLLSLIHVIFAEQLADPGERLTPYLAGLAEIRALSAEFSPAGTEHYTGVPAELTTRLAREFAAAKRAVAYGRMGTTTTRFGTITSWLIDVLNTVTGNLDEPGGAMFARPAIGGLLPAAEPGGRGFAIGRSRTRVRGLPEVLGEFPVAALAEEITTPGPGQVRTLITVAGNPVLSTPGSAALEAALARLDCMVSVDIYLNETTKHADVILPPPSALTRSHYDIVLLPFAVRAIARYTPPVLSPPDGQPAEWQILAMLAAIIQGDSCPNVQQVDDEQLASLVARETRNPGSPISGRDPAEIMDALSASGRVGPDRVLEFMLRTGRYGDGFGADPGGLTLDRLAENPNGLDLGPLEPALPGYLRTPSGKIELAHPILMADIDRLRADIANADDRLVLIGRRGLRSNNSWMHNIPSLTRGRPACTMLINPADAGRLGIESDTPVACSRGEQTIVVTAQVTDDIVRGVVSIPHGWGHGQPGTRLTAASQRPGVNVNRLTDSASMDPLASTSMLNGVPVTVAPACQERANQ